MSNASPTGQTSDTLVSQEQLLPFLLNPHSYPHRPRTVRLVQTHASFVFIAPPFVYKVKKPVNFGFLYFSTLEKRRHFCERELALNRRLSPNIYLGVVPISTREGHFTFGEGDPVVEYAVQMRRLSERYFLDKLLEHGALLPGDLDRIAVALKKFYLSQHPTEEVESWGRIDRLRISTDENFRQTEQLVGASAFSFLSSSEGEMARAREPSECPGHTTISRPAFETIRLYTDQFYKRHAGLFQSRVRNRWIRDCHGDLHLEHNHVTPRAREAKPDEVSDARLEDFAMLTRLYEPPLELPAGQFVKVCTSGPLDQTMTKALQSLARLQVESPCPSP